MSRYSHGALKRRTSGRACLLWTQNEHRVFVLLPSTTRSLTYFTSSLLKCQLGSLQQSCPINELVPQVQLDMMPREFLTFHVHRDRQSKKQNAEEPLVPRNTRHTLSHFHSRCDHLHLATRWQADHKHEARRRVFPVAVIGKTTLTMASGAAHGEATCQVGPGGVKTPMLFRTQHDT